MTTRDRAAAGRCAPAGAAGRWAPLVGRRCARCVRALWPERPVHLAVRHTPGAVRPARVDRAPRGRRRALLRLVTGRRARLVGREAGRPDLCGRVGRWRGRARRV